MKSFLISFLLFFSANISFSQDFRSVLGVPEKYTRPIDIQGPDMEAYMSSATGPKSKNRPWKVICDRDGLETFSEASTTAKSGKKLKFKDWYYVADEKGGFILLVKMNGEPDNSLNISKGSYVENYGWVEKSKVLTWTSGLRSPRTGIYLKSLILYTADAAEDVLRNANSGIKFKSSPSNSGTSVGNISLYDFYFILKKENDYYLLGRESEMANSTFFDREIVGWVHQNNQADWNTRLSLEQNFSVEAFNERKQRPSLQFTAYSVETEAINQALNGNGNSSRILTKDDPVNAEKNTIAKANPRRFIGTKLRMPVLRCSEHFYSTGILGSMSGKSANSDCPPCQAVYDEISQFSNNYDILFVVEGTTAMRDFKEEIKNAIGNLKRELTDVPNKRFGIVFYRNVNTDGKSFLDITELTSDIDVLIKKIDAAVFTEDTYDGYSTLYSALYKSAAKVGFKSNSTNIIYVIGQNPDFRENPTLKLNCIDNSCDAWVKTDKLVDQLSNLRAHLVFIQPKLPNNAVNNDLQEQCVDMMLEVSKSNFQSYKKVNDIIPSPKDVNPNIKEESNMSYIEGGSTKNVFYQANATTTLSNSDFSAYIRTTFKDVKTKQNNVAKILEDLMGGEEYNPEDIRGAGFDRGALNDKLSQVLLKAGLEVSEENLSKLTDRKVNLYVKAYVPKKIYGANYDLCSPVLFFPEKELGEYLEDLRTLVTLVNEPDDVLRTRLKETLLSLYKKYSGDSKVGNDVTLNDFVGSLTGECFKFDNPNHEFALNKIDNPRVKIETLRNFLDSLEKKYRNLETITKMSSYEFKFRTKSGTLGKNQYYWIPFEDTF
jgi:hypothetical protein